MSADALLDLGFDELHVLTHLGVVLAETKLVRRVTLVLQRGIKISRPRTGDEPDLLAW